MHIPFQHRKKLKSRYSPLQGWRGSIVGVLGIVKRCKWRFRYSEGQDGQEPAMTAFDEARIIGA